MSRAGAPSGLPCGDGREQRGAPRVGASARPRRVTLLSSSERRPAEPARGPLEVRRAGSPGPASEVQVRWALRARRDGGSAPKPLPWRPSPPRCLKPPAASRGSPGPLLSSRPPGLRGARARARLLPLPPRGTQEPASRRSGRPCRPAGAQPAAGSAGAGHAGRRAQTARRLPAAQRGDDRKPCLCLSHGLETRSVKKVLTE